MNVPDAPNKVQGRIKAWTANHLERSIGVHALACGIHTRPASLVNTVALARCKDATGTGELFQQFVATRGKPLKRLTHSIASLHRAKAAVLMRGRWNTTEISNLSEAGWELGCPTITDRSQLEISATSFASIKT